MPGSWAQHDTVVARRSQADVRDLFVEAGATSEVDGIDAFLLDDPRRTWLVDRGAIDLFLVEVKGGQPFGRRHHVTRVEPGGLMIGVEPLALSGPEHRLGVLAVPVSGTRLVQLDLARLRSEAQRTARLDAVHGSLDAWVRLLGAALRDRPRPSAMREAEPGQSLELEPTTAVRAGPKTLWFRAVEGTARLAGLTALKGHANAPLLPLTRELWLQAETKVRLVLVDAATYFRHDAAWQSIHGFHRYVLDALARARNLDWRAEHDVLKTRQELEDRGVEQALLGLASLRPAEQDEAEPLLAACKVLGEAAGFGVVRPILAEGEAPTIASVARASRFRERKVLLRDRWWDAWASPMLGFVAEGKRPVALLPRARGGYELWDPIARTRTRVDAALAGTLEAHAHEVYRPFPARAVTAKELLVFTLRGTQLDALVLTIAASVLGVFGLVVPWAMGELIDSIIPSAAVRALLQLSGVLVAVAFAGALVQLVRGSTALRLEARMGARAQTAMWDRLLRLPVAFFREHSAGDLAVRANGIETIQHALSASTLQALLSSLFGLTSLGLMFFYDVQLALVGAGLSLLGVFVAAGVGASKVRVVRRQVEAEGRLSSLVLQLLDGITKLKVAGAERRAFGIWARRFAEKRSLTMRSRTHDSALSIFDASFPALTMMVIFYFAAARQHTSGLGTGELLAFNAAYGVFTQGLMTLVSLLVQLSAIVPIYERARPILETPPEVDDLKAHPGELRGGVQVSHVSFRYAPDGPLVLDDVDFEIAPGELVAIVGASASGKSTMLRVLLGFEKPESGEVFYDRQSLATLDVAEVRRQIGVVLQNGQPVAGDLYENIVGARPLGMDDAWDAARLAGLADDIEAMPMKMSTLIGQGGHSISGGQRQRLLIARAIVAKPKIIYFDEATSALDNDAQAVVTKSLEKLQATRLVIAHRLSTIRNADKIIVLERGRVVEVGTYEELMAIEGGAFRAIAERQVA